MSKHSRKFLPKLVAPLTKKNAFTVRVVAPEGGEPLPTVGAHDVRWGGGSRCQYWLLNISTGTLSLMDPAEGSQIAFPGGLAVVVLSVFCGRECMPTVYLASEDVGQFFAGREVPRYPAEVAADWLAEQSEYASGNADRVRKGYAVAAEQVRAAAGLAVG